MMEVVGSSETMVHCNQFIRCFIRKDSYSRRLFEVSWQQLLRRYFIYIMGLNSKTVTNVVQKQKLQNVCLVLFFFNSNKNSLGMIAQLSVCFPHIADRRLRSTAYSGTSCSISRWHHSLSSVISRHVNKYFQISIFFDFMAAKVLLRRWQQMKVARSIITWVWSQSMQNHYSYAVYIYFLTTFLMYA
jgi:hypothetical protein